MIKSAEDETPAPAPATTTTPAPTTVTTTTTETVTPPPVTITYIPTINVDNSGLVGAVNKLHTDVIGGFVIVIFVLAVIMSQSWKVGKHE